MLSYGSFMEASFAAIVSADDLHIRARPRVCRKNPNRANSLDGPRGLCKQEVAGSIPAGSTRKSLQIEYFPPGVLFAILGREHATESVEIVGKSVSGTCFREPRL